MKNINVGLNGLIILGALYTFFVLSNFTAVLIALTAASGIATTLSHQKMSLAWFAYISNIILACLLVAGGFILLFGGGPSGNISDSLVNGVFVLLVSIPFLINVFFVKIRYFPRKLKNAS